MRRTVVTLIVGVGMLALPGTAGAFLFPIASGGPVTAGTEPLIPFNNVATGDFNNDEFDDLAASSDLGTFIWLNEGGGSFDTAPNSPISPSQVTAVETGDFDDDGNVDLLTGTGYNPTSWDVYLGDGTGEFSSTPDSSFGLGTGSLGSVNSTTVGDVDGDGILDLAVGLYDHSFSVALGDGEGDFDFTPESPIQVSVADGQALDAMGTITIGDFNGNGDADLAMTMTNDGGSPEDPNRGVYVANGAGDGTFTSATGNPRLIGEPVLSVVAATLDGDGFDDVSVSTGYPDTEVITLLGTSGSLAPNPNASGTVVPRSNRMFRQTAASFADNGIDDIAGSTGSEVTVLDADGIGGISEDPDSPFALPDVGGGSANAQDINTGDFNGDGYPDIVTLSSHSGDPNQARAIYPLINAPQVEDPSDADFGSVEIGESREIKVPVTDTGGAVAVIEGSGVTITGPDADQFELVDDEACGSTIENGENCEFAVRFAPTSAGARSAGLEIELAGIGIVRAGLTGTAIPASVYPPPGTPGIPDIPGPDPGTPAPPRINLKLKAPGKIRRGKTLTLTATVKNTGGSTAASVSLKTTVPGKLAKAPKRIKVSGLAAGASATKKIKVKVKRSAKKGKKLTVKVTASFDGTAKSAKKTVRIK